jgi:dephospho-CoA kinase
MPEKVVIGLIGGIGSGKSAVAAAFAALGSYVIDADRVGHALLKDPAIIQRVVSLWGAGVLDAGGQVDRKQLARIVFADRQELGRLDALLHPAMAEEFRLQIAAARSDPAIVAVVLDAALLFEAGWDALCDLVVFVDTPAEERHRRLKANRGWSDEEIDRREASQLPLEPKKLRSTHIIDNSGPESRLQTAVADLLATLSPGSAVQGEPVARLNPER